MKYAIFYTKKYSRASSADEFLIEYSRRETDLPNFIKDFSDKTIVLTISDETLLETADIKLISALMKNYSNLKIRLSYTRDSENEVLIAAKENGWRYFFREGAYCWDVLSGMLEHNPTDVYITGEMGFYIKEVAAFCHKKNCLVRVYPNVAQSEWAQTDTLKKFFIRPEAIPLYEPYVDVCELFGSVERKGYWEIYLNIYQKEKQWYGNLNECIINFNGSFQSNRIPLDFDRYRLECGHRCAKGSDCHLCETFSHLGQALKQKNAGLKSTPID